MTLEPAPVARLAPGLVGELDPVDQGVALLTALEISVPE